MEFYDHYFDNTEISKIGNWIENTQNRRFIKIIKTLCKETIKGEKLLEIGPGHGYFARACLSENIDYTAIEGNTKQSEKLKKQGFSIINTIAPPIPEIKKAPFDVIYFANLLEHMNDYAMAQKLIKETFDNLKEKGLVAIVVPNALNRKMEFYNVDYTHNYVTTPRRIAQLLTNSGFKVVFQECFSGPVFGILRYIPRTLAMLFPWKLFDSIFGTLFHKEFFYNAKQTFLETFIIIGQKETSQ